MRLQFYEILGRLIFFKTQGEFFTKISARSPPILRESAGTLKSRVHLNLCRDFFVRGLVKRFAAYSLIAGFLMLFIPVPGEFHQPTETVADRIAQKTELVMKLELQVDDMKQKYLEQNK